MLELIDRQAALEVAMRYCPDDDGSCSKAGHDIREMLDEIESLPTIEAEPVRHGRWISIDRKTAKCSCCGWWQHTKTYNLPDDITGFSGCYRFCTACGTRMDADKIAEMRAAADDYAEY